MRSRVVVASLAAVSLSACGGGSTTTVSKSVSAGSASTAMAPAADPDACDARGITDAGGESGTCKTENGTVTVVDRNQPIRIGEFRARLVKSTVSKGIAADLNKGIQAVKPEGRFVILQFKVKNLTKKPIQWPGNLGMTALTLGGSTYSPDDNQADYNTAIRVTGDPKLTASELQPGATSDGFVAFDVPASAARKLRAKGTQIEVTSIYDAVNGNNAATGTAEKRGVIRLWKQP